MWRIVAAGHGVNPPGHFLAQGWSMARFRAGPSLLNMRNGTEFLQNAFSGVLAACALVAVTILVKREYGSAAPPSLRTVELSSDEWTQASSAGHRMGPTNAVLTVVEFADFQCPVCASFERQVLRPLREECPDRVAVVFRHWPLDYHPFARPAAGAAECAARQGRFQEMYEAIFDRQDSLGILSFEQIGERAGIRDGSGFKDCLHSPQEHESVDRDLALAVRLGGNGTPTVIVNGTRFVSKPPTRAELDSILSLHQANE